MENFLEIWKIIHILTLLIWLPVQLKPFPVYPSEHVHIKLLLVSTQVAFSEQL